MRLVVTMAALAALVAPSVAQQQELDRALRAAYCVGALPVYAVTFGDMLPAVRSNSREACDDDWVKLRFASLEQCRQEFPRVMESILSGIQSSIEARQKRYSEYILIRLAASRKEEMIAIGLARAKGERDATSKKSAIRDPQIYNCQGSSNRSECVAPHDPTLASILRCADGPDDLPF